jgi:predicted transcriptional regulator
MNIQAEKLGLIEWIAKINDSSIIKKLQRIHDEYSKTSDWWDEISIEERESIKRGLKDIEEGRVHSHETAKSIYEKYL